MAKLTTKARKALPKSKFAGPGRSYPVEDKAHAANAKARASEEYNKLILRLIRFLRKAKRNNVYVSSTATSRTPRFNR